MIKKIVIHADDYATSVHISKIILECMETGNVRSISIMPNMSCFAECMDLLKQEEKRLREKKILIRKSIHLNIMEGHCVADPDRIPLLVDAKGLFCLSWGQLFLYTFLKKEKVMEQLEIEFRAQIKRFQSCMPDGYRLRIDSHQHPHMIPVVFQALMNVIRHDELDVEYIRIAQEKLTPFLKQTSLWSTFKPANLIKNVVLQMMARPDRRMLTRAGISYWPFMGLVLSGCMDQERVVKVLPGMLSQKGARMEMLFHPGRLLPEELSEEFNKPGFNEFHLSWDREIEEKAVKAKLVRR